MLAGDVKNLARMFRTGLKNDVSDPGGRDPYYLPSDSPVRGVDVILDAAAEPTLDGLGEDRELLDAIGGAGTSERARRAAQPHLVPVRLESETEEYQLGGSEAEPWPPAATVHVLGRTGWASSAPGRRPPGPDLEGRGTDRAVWMRRTLLPRRCGRPAGLLLYPGPLPVPIPRAGAHSALSSWAGRDRAAIRAGDRGEQVVNGQHPGRRGRDQFRFDHRDRHHAEVGGEHPPPGVPGPPAAPPGGG